MQAEGKKPVLVITNTNTKFIMYSILIKQRERYALWIRTLILIMLAAFLLPDAHAQSGGRTITGTVTDADSGEPLVGAGVFVPGTMTGAMTDVDGRYVIEVDDSIKVLSASIIGYEVQDATIGVRAVVDFALKQEITDLDEVVVVGFGTQKKSNLTGAVASIDNDVFENRPLQTASQALIGVSPGLNVSVGSGFLDTEPNIEIRGAGTIGIGSDDSPLILIDGMPGSLNSINPQSIESISVLKDAAASSIYGSRAAFGVILVTTKRGSESKLEINYNNSFRWNMPVNMPKMADSYSFALFMNDLDPWSSDWFGPDYLARIQAYQQGTLKTPIYVENDGVYNSYYDENGNTDWYDVYFRDQAFAQEHNISISGGNQTVKAYAALGYMDMGGLSAFNQDRYGRLTADLKVDLKLWKILDISYSTRLTKVDYRRPTYLTDTEGTFFDIARQSWPTFPLYDNYGNYYNTGLTGPKTVQLLDGGVSSSTTFTNVQQVALHIEPLKNWHINGSINYQGISKRGKEYLNQTYGYDANNVRYSPADCQDSYIWESYLGSTHMNYDIYTSYEADINSHNIKLTAGMQAESFITDDFDARNSGLIVPSLPFLDVSTGLDPTGEQVPATVTGGLDRWSTAGFFGRLNYNYKMKWLFEANIRYDGSSRFLVNNRWMWSPSFSVGYNIAKENFWGPLSEWVEMFKIRASYGILPNQNVNAWYPSYPSQPYGNNNSWWLVGGSQMNTANAPELVNRHLTWEKIHTIDAGVDIAMFKNRLNINFDWYQRDTKDMIGPAPVLPDILGTTAPLENNAELRTRGWELAMSWQDNLKNGFYYKVGFSLSDAKSIVTKYNSTNKTIGNYYTGMTIGEIWGLHTIGIAKTAEEMARHLASLPNGGQTEITNGSNYGEMTVGDIMYADINRDGKISFGDNTADNPGDQSIIGNSTPRYRYGINIALGYKGIDFSVFFQGVGKMDFAPTPGSTVFYGVGYDFWSTQVLTEHLDYFRADESHPLGQNLDAYYARPLTYSNQNMHVQTRYLQDASYLRLKNVQLGYTLPNKITEKAHIYNLRLYVSGENLLTITKLPDFYDPETLYMGFQGSGYPILKTWSFGLSVNF